ncbi:hypothetical protein DM860_001385 [Cuscuta australis]|uniref:Uncharacterized protein n=1 Tax=Cuscuta australis TaxID=267555 RepID=A0A328E8P3_9ASTE|nr:hypothetical protein DM860_001385 [Cuscuta australis]
MHLFVSSLQGLFGVNTYTVLIIFFLPLCFRIFLTVYRSELSSSFSLTLMLQNLYFIPYSFLFLSQHCLLSLHIEISIGKTKRNRSSRAAELDLGASLALFKEGMETIRAEKQVQLWFWALL